LPTFVYLVRGPSRLYKKNPQRSCLEFSAGLSYVQKDSLQLDLVSLYTILCEIARKIIHLQEQLDKGGNDELWILNRRYLATTHYPS